MRHKQRRLLVATGLALALSLSVFPIVEMPFGGRLSPLDLAAGALSGGGFSLGRGTMITLIALLTISFVASILMLFRPERTAPP